MYQCNIDNSLQTTTRQRNNQAQPLHLHRPSLRILGLAKACRIYSGIMTGKRLGSKALVFEARN